MLTSSPLESSKKELSLDIDSFDKPREHSDVAAWSQLLLDLIFLKPGSYPSIPEMGVGIEDFQYEFLDEAIDALSSTINEQRMRYLPDVPLAGLQISKIEQNGEPILIIQFIFETSDGASTSAVAVNVSKRKFLDFEVSW